MDVVCHLPIRAMVSPTGIEPVSSVLQTVAMTTSAKATYWYLVTGSNRRPSPCKGDTLPLS